MTALLLALVTSQPTLQPPELERAVATFKVRDAWISPAVIREFMPWQSDPNRFIVRTIDVAAALDTNRYGDEVKNNAKGASLALPEGASIQYEWVGRTKRGLHVLLVRESGGGSGHFVSLVVMRLSVGSAVDSGGVRYPTLDLSAERFLGLGDRVAPTVRIEGNVVSGTAECTIPSCRDGRFRLDL